MKIQDGIFLLAFLLLICRRDPRLAAIFGITSLVLSIPLFSFWIFFTAERLIWYAAFFFLLSVILNIIKLKHINE